MTYQLGYKPSIPPKHTITLFESLNFFELTLFIHLISCYKHLCQHHFEYSYHFRIEQGNEGTNTCNREQSLEGMHKLKETMILERKEFSKKLSCMMGNLSVRNVKY